MARCHVAPWMLAVGLAVGCGGNDEQDIAAEPLPAPDGPVVVNEAWRIIKMATAHDILTIEVEIADLTRATSVARELIQPVEGQYAEVLVYVYAEGEGEGGYLPKKRVQWTAADGLTEIDY